jgi:hypothetical protein
MSTDMIMRTMILGESGHTSCFSTTSSQNLPEPSVTVSVPTGGAGGAGRAGRGGRPPAVRLPLAQGTKQQKLKSTVCVRSCWW